MRKLRKLVLVTFSGAHGTGKTTLVKDLKRALHRDGHIARTVPSCSHRAFEHIRSGAVALPEGAEMPERYDDINRLGLRGFFQRLLPDALATEVEAAVQVDRPVGTAYLLVDRWFTDIYAYSVTESTDLELPLEMLELCRTRLEGLLLTLLDRAEVVQRVHLFIPVATCDFEVMESDKFRATGDRYAWEATCLTHWRAVARDRLGLCTLTTTRRMRRVDEVMRHLGLQGDAR